MTFEQRNTGGPGSEPAEQVHSCLVRLARNRLRRAVAGDLGRRAPTGDTPERPANPETGDGLWSVVFSLAAQKHPLPSLFSPTRTAADLRQDKPEALARGLTVESMLTFVEQVVRECRQLLEEFDDHEKRTVALGSLLGDPLAELTARLNCTPSTLQRKLQLVQALWQAKLDSGSTSQTVAGNAPPAASRQAGALRPAKSPIPPRRFSGRRRMIVAAIALLLVVGLGVGAWKTWNRTVGPEHLPERLRIIGSGFSGYSTFRSDAFLQACKDAGVEVEFIQEEDSRKSAEHFNRGEVELRLGTLEETLVSRLKGKIVALIDNSLGDAVVLNTKKYDSLECLGDLHEMVEKERAHGRRLRLALARNSVHEYLALVLQSRLRGFRLSDFDLVQVADPAEAVQALLDPAREVAVAISSEPSVSRAVDEGCAVGISCEQIQGTIVHVLVASDELLRSKPDLLGKVVQAYYGRMDTLVVHPAQMQLQVALDGKMSRDEACAVVHSLEFLTAIQARDWVASGKLGRRIAFAATVLLSAGRLDPLAASAEQFCEPRFLTEAAKNTQGLIGLVSADNPELANRLAGKKEAAATPATPGQVAAAPHIDRVGSRPPVVFATGSASLTDLGKKQLLELAGEIELFSRQTVAVHVLGYASPAEPADKRDELSRQRADAVVAYLRQAHVEHQVVGEGRGQRERGPDTSPDKSESSCAEIQLVRVDAMQPLAKPALHVLTIGIGAYKGNLALEFPVADAQAIAAVLGQKSKSLFRQVNIHQLTDAQATRKAVLQELDQLGAQMTQRDVCLIFYAGHGVKDRKGSFCLVPVDGDLDHVISSCVGDFEIKRALQGLPGKVIVLLDACHAGAAGAELFKTATRGVDRDVDDLAVDLGNNDTGVIFMAASMGAELSLEKRDWGHGAFTKALLEGLQGRADTNKDGQVSWNELDAYVTERVKELTNGRQHAVTAKPTTIRPFALTQP